MAMPLGRPNRSSLAGREERHRHRLGEPEPDEHAPQPPTIAAGASVEATGVRRRRDRPGDPLVAVVAGDLLDHVDLGRRVVAATTGS